MKTSSRSRRGRGEGNVEQLPSGEFRARYSTTDPSTGKRVRPSRTFADVTQARAWLREQIAKADRGDAPANGAETLEVWYRDWLAGKRDSREPGTCDGYERHFDHHILPVLGKVRLRDLTHHLKGWQRKLVEGEVSAGQRRKVMVSLGVCLNQAVRERKMLANPLKAIARPKWTPGRLEVYSEAEVRSILSSLASHPREPLFRLMLDTGMRPGEVLGLHWPEVDLERGTVRVIQSLEYRAGGSRLKAPKTESSRRTVALSSGTVEVLRQLRVSAVGAGRDVHRGPLFTDPEGQLVSRHAMRSMWRAVCRLAKVPQRKPSILRHTSAVLLLSHGVNVKVVSRRLGHSDIAITLRHYAAFLPEADERAAEVMGHVLAGGGEADLRSTS